MSVTSDARANSPLLADLLTTCGVVFVAQFFGNWLILAWMPESNRLGAAKLVVGYSLHLAPYILLAGLAGAALPFVLRSERPVRWSILVGVLSSYHSIIQFFMALGRQPADTMRASALLLAAGLNLFLPVGACLLAIAVRSRRQGRLGGA